MVETEMTSLYDLPNAFDEVLASANFEAIL